MEVRAVAKFIRVQPRKMRIVADHIRGKSALQSAALLRFHPSKGARTLRKVLISAIANAQENHGLSPETLRIASIMIDEGPKLKRIQARAMGRANRILKPMSHITLIVEDVEGRPTVKPHGTKPKARPKFDAPKKSAKKRAEATAAAAEPEQKSEEPMAEEVAAGEPTVEEMVAEAGGTEFVAEEPAEAAPAGDSATEPADEASDVSPEGSPEEKPDK